jgi:phosphatidylglycerol:prolipoprotein diacylglycerol transferase
MPLGFQIGPVFVRYYGIILMLGAVAAAWMAEREARRREQNPEIVWDAMVWVLIAGIIGARIWHILTPQPTLVAQGITTKYYLTHPLDALAIWKGGLGIAGAVIGGGLAMYLYCRKHKIDFVLWADIVAPGLALAQAIGRWGNFVNQELYGPPTDLPWGIPIEPIYRLPEYAQYTHFHPVFLYESLWNLANMALLIWMGRKLSDRLKSGDIFLTYLVMYPLGRFLLEFIRLDSPQVGAINTNQAFMAAVAIIAAAALYWRHRSKTSEHPEESSPSETSEEDS